MISTLFCVVLANAAFADKISEVNITYVEVEVKADDVGGEISTVRRMGEVVVKGNSLKRTITGSDGNTYLQTIEGRTSNVTFGYSDGETRNFVTQQPSPFSRSLENLAKLLRRPLPSDPSDTFDWFPYRNDAVSGNVEGVEMLVVSAFPADKEWIQVLPTLRVKAYIMNPSKELKKLARFIYIAEFSATAKLVDGRTVQLTRPRKRSK
jgi:hypothetical protein